MARKTRLVKPAVRQPANGKRPPAANGKRRPAAPTKRFTLHGAWRSGPTYKVALMLSLARQPYAYVHVDLSQGEHRTPDYLARNRYGQVPCLFDGKLSLCQSAAILEYLGESLGKFLPAGAESRARMREWLFWDFDKLSVPVYRTRAITLGFRKAPDDVAALWRADAVAALEVLEANMPESGFLVGGRPSLADIDIYGAVRYAPEGKLSLGRLPRLSAWKARMEALPGFGPPEDLLPKESRA